MVYLELSLEGVYFIVIVILRLSEVMTTPPCHIYITGIFTQVMYCLAKVMITPATLTFPAYLLK